MASIEDIKKRAQEIGCIGTVVELLRIGVDLTQGEGFEHYVVLSVGEYNFHPVYVVSTCIVQHYDGEEHIVFDRRRNFEIPTEDGEHFSVQDTYKPHREARASAFQRVADELSWYAWDEETRRN